MLPGYEGLASNDLVELGSSVAWQMGQSMWMEAPARALCAEGVAWTCGGVGL